MKELYFIAVDGLLATKCPYGKKQVAGLVPIMIGSDQCWNCSSFKGIYGAEDTSRIFCNYEDTHDTKK